MNVIKKISDKFYLLFRYIFDRKECVHRYHIIDIQKSFVTSTSGSTATSNYISRCERCGSIKKDCF